MDPDEIARYLKDRGFVEVRYDGPRPSRWSPGVMTAYVDALRYWVPRVRRMWCPDCVVAAMPMFGGLATLHFQRMPLEFAGDPCERCGRVDSPAFRT